MSQVIADPKEQFRFAAYLREVSNFLYRRRNQFQTSMNEACIVCQDSKYERFHKAVECALESCEQFEVLTVQYAAQLDQKSRLGDRYLDVGGASGSSGLGKSGIASTAETIGEFEVSLTRFADANLPCAKSILQTVQNRILQLEQRSCELRIEISNLEIELASQSCDDEAGDVSYDDESGDESYAVESALRDAEDRLYQIESAKRRLDEAASSFLHAQRRMDELLGTGTKQACHFLRNAMDNLAAYRAASPGDMVSTHASKTDNHFSSQPSLTPTTFGSFNRTPLPKGFVWVPVTDIDVDRELAQVQGPADFKKVPYQTVRDSLDRFREKIVPELLKGTTRDALTTMDIESGVFDTSGISGAYDAFLGDDPIHLTFDAVGRGYGITNGRHRIRAAIDAGWTHVPVTIGGRS